MTDRLRRSLREWNLGSTFASSAGDDAGDEIAFGRMLRLGWVLVVAGTVLGAVAGLSYAVLRPDRYSSTAEVLVKPLSRDPLGTSDPFGEVVIDTELRAVSSDAVLRRASERLADHPGLRELRELDARAFPGSEVLRLTVTAPTTGASRDRAQAIASAYLDQRAEDARRVNRSERPAFEQQIAIATDQLAAAVVAEAAAPAGPQREVLSNRVRLLSARVSSLQDWLDQLDRYRPDPGRIERGPSAPVRAGAGTPVLVVAGVTVGMFLGFVAAALRARFDRRVHHPDEVAAALGVPVLGRVPNEPVGEPAAVHAPASGGAGAYRRIHSELAGVLARQEIDGADATAPVLAVLGVSSLGGADRAVPVVAANLASLFAAGGRPVTLLASTSQVAAARLLGADAASAVLRDGRLEPTDGTDRGVDEVLHAARADGELVVLQLDATDDPAAQRYARAADVVVVVCPLPSALTRDDLVRARADLARAGCRSVVAVVTAGDAAGRPFGGRPHDVTPPARAAGVTQPSGSR